MNEFFMELFFTDRENNVAGIGYTAFNLRFYDIYRHIPISIPIFRIVDEVFLKTLNRIMLS